MEGTQKQLSLAEVAAWGSAAVTFGLVQGALYLRSYWGHFGLDPFQFVVGSELALAGLAGIGVVLFLMLVALLLGGWLEAKLTRSSSKSRLFAWLGPVFFFGVLGASIWWTNAWHILIGFLLTIACALIVHLSPVIPVAVKNSPWLIHALILLVYVSIVSDWLGVSRARTISAGDGAYVVAITTEEGVQDGLTLVGRLGDSYVLWDQVRKIVLLVSADDVESLEIARRGTGMGAQ